MSRVADHPGKVFHLCQHTFFPVRYVVEVQPWRQLVIRQVAAGLIEQRFSNADQSQSKEDENTVVATEKFFSESDSWIFPPTEKRFREGIEAMTRYRDRLTGNADPEAQFFARADNLREWLAEIEKRLGSLTRRLGDSVATTRINENLALDPSAEAAQAQPDNLQVRTSWFEVDDVFFEARATSTCPAG